jgi:hypothetical protein
MDFRKVGSDSVQNLCGFRFAYAPLQPWTWNTMSLAVVTASTPIAQWNQIMSDSPWAIGRSDRNKMISDQCPEKAFLIPAHGTSIPPVVQHEGFLVRRKGIWEIALTCASSCISCAVHLWVLFMALTFTRIASFTVLDLPLQGASSVCDGISVGHGVSNLRESYARVPSRGRLKGVWPCSEQVGFSGSYPL